MNPEEKTDTPVGRPGSRPNQVPGRPVGRLCSTESLIMSVGRPGGRPFSCYDRPSGRPSYPMHYPVHVCAHRSIGRSTSPCFVHTGRPALLLVL